MGTTSSLFETLTKNKSLYLIIWVLIWIIYNFYTIGFSPIPWLDEIVYADMADSLLKTGKMYSLMSLHPSELGKEVLRYGPVYIYIQAFMINIFGLKIEVIRMLNLLSGVSIVFLFFWVTKKLKLNELSSALIIILITTDTIFISNMHSGRMDLFCSALFYLALFLFIFKRNIYLVPLLGLLFAASFLSTPRIGFYFLSLLALFVYDIISRKDQILKIILNYAVLALTFSIPVLLWIYLKFNGIEGYFKNIFDDPLVQSHTGFNFFPNKYQIPVILICLLLFIVVITKKKFQFPDILFVIIILSHLLFIKEVGPYSAMVMPVVYLSIILSSWRLKDEQFIKYLVIASTALLLLINISIFGLKSSLILAGKETRSPDRTIKLLSSYNFKDKNILADYKYYYVVKNKGANFISFDVNETILNQEILQQIDYILISERGLKKLKSRFPEQIFHKTALISNIKQSSIYNYIARFGFTIEANYDGYLISTK